MSMRSLPQERHISSPDNASQARNCLSFTDFAPYLFLHYGRVIPGIQVKPWPSSHCYLKIDVPARSDSIGRRDRAITPDGPQRVSRSNYRTGQLGLMF